MFTRKLYTMAHLTELSQGKGASIGREMAPPIERLKNCYALQCMSTFVLL